MIKESAIRAVFEGSMELGADESCLVVTDTIKQHIGRAFYEYASGITTRAKIVVIEPAVEHATEPPADIAELMLGYDAELLITDKSLTHTKARRDATAAGARIATMPGITEDIANRCLEIDYRELRKESARLYELLKGSSEIRLSTALGTRMFFTVGGSAFFGQNGGSYDRPGAYGNLPEGEVSFAPERCDGVYVVDASFPGLGLLEAPLRFTVRDGIVREISGPRSEEVINRLDRVGPAAYKVAELGIGLNPKARVIGNILEDEKVRGTVHIAVGNDLSYGGTNDVPLHLDGVIRKARVEVDGRLIVDGVDLNV